MHVSIYQKNRSLVGVDRSDGTVENTDEVSKSSLIKKLPLDHFSNLGKLNQRE